MIDNEKWLSYYNDLLENSEEYHKYFYDKEIFTGPSLHFHRRSLEVDYLNKPEVLYAMLVSWGMHRMGGGPKMVEYEKFKRSIENIKNEVDRVNSLKEIIIVEKKAIEVKNLFLKLEAMKTSKKITGNSKVLAHLCPNLIIPIDGEYTMQFINGLGHRGKPKGYGEFEFFEDFHNKIVFKLAENSSFLSLANKWINSKLNPWDTSIPKVIDNLIIGKISNSKPKKSS